MKVGETFTIERECNPSTGFYSVPVRLSGNVALLGIDVIKPDFQKCGEPNIHRYTFQVIAPGKAEIQFAQYCLHKVENVIYEDVKSFDVEADGLKNSTCGGWSDYEDLTDEDIKMFNEAMAGHLGVTYTPSKVSKQIVNGIKCRYVCIGRLATLGRETFPAIVEIYYPTDGSKPSVEIKRVLL